MVGNAPPGSTPTVEQVFRASNFFTGSREFLRTAELLAAYRSSPPVKASRAPGLLQAYATNVGFALELALKSRLLLDGKAPPKEHRYSELFKNLSAEAKTDVTSGLLVNGQPASPNGVLGVLKECDGTFVVWRYVHDHVREGHPVAFHEGNLFALIQGIHASVVRMRPDFEPWAGVISR